MVRHGSRHVYVERQSGCVCGSCGCVGSAGGGPGAARRLALWRMMRCMLRMRRQRQAGRINLKVLGACPVDASAVS
jgi:hypothetical protein